MAAIRSHHPDARFEGVAGPTMRAAGCRALAQSEQLAVMGLTEVLGHLPALLRLRGRLVRYFRDNPPDVFVGIDAPDFNLALERSLKRSGITTVHWVSPSVWAWRKYRLPGIRRSVDLMLTLFPFEAQFYQQHGVPAHFTGHPLADEVDCENSRAAARERLELDAHRPCIALLPGSREQEVKRLLPVFLDTAILCKDALADLQLVLPVATPRLEPLCRALLDLPAYRHLQVVPTAGLAREAMQAADAVLVASGTATLECLLVNRPMVIAYRMHPLSCALARRMLRVPWFSLPNNLLGKRQVPEYLQGDAKPLKLAGELLELLRRPEKATQQTVPFEQLHRQLRRNAAQQAALQILGRIG
jgi:lipid-A-disaccharide synthase